MILGRATLSGNAARLCFKVPVPQKSCKCETCTLRCKTDARGSFTVSIISACCIQQSRSAGACIVQEGQLQHSVYQCLLRSAKPVSVCHALRRRDGYNIVIIRARCIQQSQSVCVMHCAGGTATMCQRRRRTERRGPLPTWTAAAPRCTLGPARPCTLG